MMRKPLFLNNHIYHIFNRGVDKRTIFQEEKDYLRFVHQLYEFNDEDPVLNVTYYFNPKTMSVEAWKEKKQIKTRKQIPSLFYYISLIFG